MKCLQRHLPRVPRGNQMWNGRLMQDLSGSWIANMLPAMVSRSLADRCSFFLVSQRSGLVASRKSTFSWPGSAYTQSPFNGMPSRGSLVVLWSPKSTSTDKVNLSSFRTQPPSPFNAVHGLQYRSAHNNKRKKKNRKERRRTEHNRRDQRLRVGISRAPSPQALHALLTKEGGSFFNVRIVATAFLALSKVLQDDQCACVRVMLGL
jgi:hypothetical protein